MSRKLTQPFLLFLFLLGSYFCLGQDPLLKFKVEEELLSLTIFNDLDRGKEYGKKTPKTIILSNRGQRVKVDLIEMTSDPDSLLFWASAFGEPELARLISKDHDWLEIIKKYNSQTEELTRIKKRQLNIINLSVEIIKHQHLHRMLKKKTGWNKFYSRYPDSNGVYSLTRPIIVNNKAILYMSRLSGRLNGYGAVFLLEKKENWKVVHYVEVWVS